MSLPDSTAGRYAAVADTFGALVRGTTDWDAPAPPDGWVARDVVWHLVDWIPDVLRDGASLDLPKRDTTRVDPVDDWSRFDAAMRLAIAQRELLDGPFSHPQAGTMTLGAAVDMLATPDVFMHSWDLAAASGQELVLDPDYSAQLLAGMEGIDGMLRSSGHYGPKVPVPAEADVATRLIAFIGRDPQFRSP